MRYACANPHCAERTLIPLNRSACDACLAILPPGLHEAIALMTSKTDRYTWTRNLLSARVIWSAAARVGEAFDRSKP